MTSCVTLALLSIAVLLFPVFLNAKEPPSIPLVRVETGMHTTMIRRVLPDLPRNRLITCSDDKTIRIWQMPEMRLISTLRVPIDNSHEGQLYAVAVSPDGKTVAAGGWTGWDWDNKAYIYFFDVATGELIRRMSGFDNVVSSLTWLPDGQHLAVGLQGYSGFHIIRVKDAKIVMSDAQYRDDFMDMDVSPSGMIVTAACDGFVRLYSPHFKLVARQSVEGGKQPVSLRFSPDGESIAVGFIDIPAVSVISARDLSLKYRADTAKIVNQVGFASVVWSSDGSMIYASGEFKGEGMNPVYRWRKQGRGAPEKIPLTQNRINELQQMPDNQIAFAAEDPGVGVMGPDGKLKFFKGPDIANFSRAQRMVALSDDASVVRYPIKRDNRIQHTFSIFAGGDQETAKENDTRLSRPIVQSKNIILTDWMDSFKPKINGNAIALEDYEISRCYAISPDQKSVLLGTEWAIRLLKPDAAEIWNVKLPAVVWAVNISRDGMLAVAALSDGTLRWYRMSDGAEVLAYFPHGNGRDWIAWVPEGYYMSSVYGDNYIGWHVNRGKDLTPDFYRAVQFDRILYRPDIVMASFRSRTNVATRSITSLQTANFDIYRLSEIAPPRLRLRQAELRELADGRSRLKLEIFGEKNSIAVKDYTVFVNDIPVTPARERMLAGSDMDRFRRTVYVDLNARDNDIRVEAFNGSSMGIAETYVGLPAKLKPAPIKGDLYLLAVGVNEFPALPRSSQLAYAAQDAEELAKAWKIKGGGNYTRTMVHILSDLSEGPDRQSIINAVKFVDHAGPDDTVVIFLASHGISDPSGNYYFVPRDATLQDFARVKNGEDAPSLISWTVFFDALRRSAGRRILIVDTCQARNIEGKFESHSLMKRSAASQFALIVASKGNEESQEYAVAKHGLFTYAFLNSLKSESDKDRNGLVSLQEVFDYTVPAVEKLRNKRTGPQTPQMAAPRVLAEMPVMLCGY